MGIDKEADIKFKGYDDRFSTYVWNPETRQVFGRTGIMWAKLTIFYIIFYCGLAAFAGLCYYLFQTTLTDEHPKWILSESLIGTNPGMGYRPMPDPDKNAESTLIWYQQEDREDAAFWHGQLAAYINDVEDPTRTEEDVENCSYNNTFSANKKVSCRVDTNDFGSECSKRNNFGYLTAEPCVLLKLNRIFGWKPEGYGLIDGVYNERELIEDLKEQVENGMPEDLQKYILRELKKHRNHEAKFLSTIWISCAGEGVADRENIGPIAYYPQQGIPGYSFPYLKQKGYQSPFIFVQLTRPRTKVLINVECKAWAKNIIHDRINRLGSVHFEMMID